MGIEASNVGQQSEKGFWREATLQVLTTIFRKQAANAELRKQLFEANVNAARDENHMQVACVCASAGSCVRVPAICMRRSRTRVCAHTRAHAVCARPLGANLVTGVRFPPAYGVPVCRENAETSTRRAPAAGLSVPPLGGLPSVACAS